MYMYMMVSNPQGLCFSQIHVYQATFKCVRLHLHDHCICRLCVGSRVVCGPPYLIMVLWRNGTEVGICEH